MFVWFFLCFFCHAKCMSPCHFVCVTYVRPFLLPCAYCLTKIDTHTRRAHAAQNQRLTCSWDGTLWQITPQLVCVMCVCVRVCLCFVVGWVGWWIGRPLPPSLPPTLSPSLPPSLPLSLSLWPPLPLARSLSFSRSLSLCVCVCVCVGVCVCV